MPSFWILAEKPFGQNNLKPAGTSWMRCSDPVCAPKQKSLKITFLPD